MSDLDPARIERELDRLGALIGRPLVVAAVTGSTNDDAKEAALRGAPHGAAFLADAQRSGRGRGGHVWHSPPGENLYMSVVLRPRLKADRVPQVALVTGVLAARVAARFVGEGAERIGVKWPNDMFAGGRKLGGILVEGRLRGASVSHVVVGLGLNVGTLEFPAELADRATSLLRLGCERVDRSVLAAALLAEVGAGLAVFEAAGLAPFLSELSARDVLRGASVEVGGERGVAEGIDHDGRLLIRREGGSLARVASGEVTLLRSG